MVNVLLNFELSGWIILALLAPGLIVLIAVVTMFLLNQPKKGQLPMPTPGYYHVMGIDRQSGQRRETTFHATSPEAAKGRAEMEGIVVTEIRQVNESL